MTERGGVILQSSCVSKYLECNARKGGYPSNVFPWDIANPYVLQQGTILTVARALMFAQAANHAGSYPDMISEHFCKPAFHIVC